MELGMVRRRQLRRDAGAPGRMRRPGGAPLRSRGGRDGRQSSARHARWGLTLITLGAMGGVFLILKPFLQPIILAVLLASVFSPVRSWVFSRCSKRANVAALACVAIVFLVVVVPSSLFISALAKQGLDAYQKAQAWVTGGQLEAAVAKAQMWVLAPENGGLESPVPDDPGLKARMAAHARAFVRERLQIDGAEDFKLQNTPLGELVMAGSQWALALFGKYVVPGLKAVGGFVVSFFVMLFVLFFAFRDGQHALAYVRHLSPLSATQENALLDRVKEISRAVFMGTFITAVAQGLAAMVAFKLVGIPALFWGTMLGAASIVPVVGTAVVWVPAVGYLLLTGHSGAALFLGLWCALVVGSIDNFLRPMLMGGKVGMSSVAVFFAILGGIQLFGAMGIIYGPLVFGLCAVCFYIYEIENAQFLKSQDTR